MSKDFAHYESPIAQWLERPTGILEGHGFASRWGTRKESYYLLCVFLEV